MQGKTERIEQARKELDQYVQTQCKGLSTQACTTKLQASQSTASTVTEILTGFTLAGIAIDIKDLLQAKTMQDRSLAVLGTVLPGLGDAVKGLVKGAKGGVTAVDAAVATGSPITTRFVNGVTVVDQRTGTVFNGTVDLQPTFDRIAAGATGLSRNDGTVFRNLPDRTTGQILLPVKPPGYYTEYVVPTPGINGPGPQRIVTGQGGEMFYTPDHYGTFIPVKKP